MTSFHIPSHTAPFAPRRGLWALPLLTVCVVALLSLVPLTVRAQEPTVGLAWAVDGADWRLMAWPEDPREPWCRVDIPPALQGSRDVRVMDSAGAPLPVRELRTGERLLALEVAVPTAMRHMAGIEALRNPHQGIASRLAIYIYLAEAPVAAPPPQAPALPVREAVDLAYHLETIKARPSTGDEFAIYQWKAPAMRRDSSASTLPTAPKPPFLEPPQEEDETVDDDGRKRRKKRKHGEFDAVRYHFSTVWHVERPGLWQFAAPRADTGPWFLYLDGESVADWGSSEGDSQQLWSAPKQLAAGLYRFDYFGIADYEQHFPTLMARQLPEGAVASAPEPAFTALPADGFVTTNGTRALRLDGHDQVLSAGYVLDLGKAVVFAGTGTRLQAATLSDLSANLFGRQVTERLLSVRDGHQVPLAATQHVALPIRPQTALALELGDEHGFHVDLRTTLRLDWTTARLIDLPFRLTEAPTLEPRRGSSLSIGYRLREPADLPPTLRPLLEIDWALLDAAGKRLPASRTLPVPVADFAKTVPLPWPADAVRIVATPCIQGLPVAHPQVISLISADAAAPLTAFQTAANLLETPDGLAMLQRPRGDGRPTNAPLPTVQRLVLVDAMVAPTRHLSEPLDPVAWMRARDAALTVRHLPLGDDGLQGGHAVLGKFDVLDEVLKSDADAVVWLVGDGELQEDLDVVDYRDHLAWITLATLSAGKLPILVTVPPHGTLTADHLRPYALAVRELGAHFRVPVVDFYTAAILNNTLDDYYRMGADGAIRSAVPNATGAAWYLSQVMNTVRSVNQRAPGSH